MHGGKKETQLRKNIKLLKLQAHKNMVWPEERREMKSGVTEEMDREGVEGKWGQSW